MSGAGSPRTWVEALKHLVRTSIGAPSSMIIGTSEADAVRQPNGQLLHGMHRTPVTTGEPERAVAAPLEGLDVEVAPVSRRARFTQILPVTNGPQGLLAIPSRNLFVASSEVDVPDDNIRATIALFRLGRDDAQFPQLTSSTVNGGPIGWGALSALTADQRRPGRLWTVSDSYYSPTKLYAIDTARRDDRPATITSSLTVTENGQPVGLDAEGLATRPAGGFWLASEGATGATNQIVLLNARADSNAGSCCRPTLPPGWAAAAWKGSASPARAPASGWASPCRAH